MKIGGLQETQSNRNSSKTVNHFADHIRSGLKIQQRFTLPGSKIKLNSINQSIKSNAQSKVNNMEIDVSSMYIILNKNDDIRI